MNEIPRPQQITVGMRPSAIVPQTMDDAFRLGKAICLAGMAPKGMDTPEKCMIAIMRGMEVGLTPMQALDKIAIVNGRPTIWGDGALGLVRGSGLCEWVKENIEGEGDQAKAVCQTMRRGEPDPVTRTFSVADAKKANLWGKQGPWQQFPKRMLAMRARAFCLRDGFADVLGGLYLKEEIDGDEPERVVPPARLAPSAVPQIEAKPEEASPQSRRAPSAIAPPAKKQEPVPYDPEAIRKRFADAAASASNIGELDAAWEEIVAPIENDMFPPDKDELAKIDAWRRAELDGSEEGEGP